MANQEKPDSKKIWNKLKREMTYEFNFRMMLAYESHEKEGADFLNRLDKFLGDCKECREQ